MNQTCPSEAELLAFHRGCLPEAVVEVVADHLDGCSTCDAKVQRFDSHAGAADPLLAVLRNQLTLTPAPPGSAAPSRPPAPGDSTDWPVLPGYEIVGTLGRGGMGEVYKARQVRLNRFVALKRLRSADTRATARSRTEAEALAQLQHPGVVQIHEFIEHPGGVYLALELVEGGSLAARLDGRPRPPLESAELVEAVARAVHYAHANGIVHRDLKPANILLAGDGLGPPGGDTKDPGATLGPLTPPSYRPVTPKVTDFGIAKQLAAGPGETRAGDVIGTPAYMAPEQAAGETRVGPAADVYGLGVVLYEMLTGRVPLQGPTPLDTLILVRTADPVPPRQLQPGIPRDLEVICLKCLEKDVARRYPTAEALAEDLHRFREHVPILARPTPVWERAWKATRRHPVVAALSVALVLVTLTGFGLVLWQLKRADATAVDEANARRAAEESERRTRQLTAGIALERGITLSESGELDRGLVWLARSLELAAEGQDPDLEQAVRCNLAGWLSYHSRQLAAFPHDDWVWAIAFSPDGKTVLTGSKDGTARLWDAATGRPKTEPLRHGEPVWAAAFSPDGTTFATGGGDEERPGGGGTVRVWDAGTGRLRYPPLSHPAAVSAVAFTPDGAGVMTVCPGQVRVWRAADGRPVGEPVRHPQPAKHNRLVQPALAAVFAPDGKTVASGGEDGTIRLWDAATGKPKADPIRATGPVLAVAFSPDGQAVLTGGFDGAAQLWDVASGRRRGPAWRHRGQVNAVVFSHDGQIAATSGAVEDVNAETGERKILGGEVTLWQVATGRQLGSSLPHPNAVWGLAFSPDDRILLTGCRDAGARFYLVANGAQMGRALPHDGTVTAVAFSPDGTTALASSAGGHFRASARLWTTPRGQSPNKPHLQNADLYGVQFSPDSQLLLTWADDRTSRVVDRAGRPAGPVRSHPGVVTAATFSPDGRTYATGCRTGQVQVWDRAGPCPRFEHTRTELVSCVAIAPDGRTLLVGGFDGNLEYLEAESGRAAGPPLRPGAAVRSVDVSPDGKTALVGAECGVYQVDLASREVVRAWTNPGAERYARFYPSGDRALVLTGGFVTHADLTGEREVELPRFHPEGKIDRVAISPDGRYVLISNNSDRSARVWDVATGKTLGPPPGWGGARSVAFSPDGRWLAVGDLYGRLAIWDTPAPVGGEPDRVKLWVQTLTGLELDPQGVIRSLAPDALAERKQRLEECGGPPEVGGGRPGR